MEKQDTSEFTTSQDLAYIASNTGLVFAGSIVSNVIQVIYGILVARVIGAKSLGLFYLATSLTGMATLIGTLGLSHGVLRYIGTLYSRRDFQSIRKIVRGLLGIVAVISISLSLLLFLLAKVISVKWFNQPELSIFLTLLAITIPLECLRNICFSSIQTLKRIKYMVYIQSLVTPVFQFILVGFMFLLGLRLMAVVLGYMASVILSAVMAGYYLSKILRLQDSINNNDSESVSITAVIRFSFPLFISQLSSIPSERLVLWLLGSFWHVESVAVYGVANRLRGLGMIIFQSLNSVYGPMISGLHDTKQLKILEKLYKTTTRWIVSLGMPIYILMILLAGKLLNLFGEEFTAGKIPLIILCLGEIIFLFGSSGSYMVAMSGHPMVGLFNGIAMASLTIALSFAFIPKYGIIGAASAVAIAYTIVNFIRLIQVYHFLQMHPYDWCYIKPLISITIASLVLILIKQMVHIKFPFDFAIYLTVFFTVYIGLLLFMKLEQDESDLLQRIRFRFFGRFSSKST